MCTPEDRRGSVACRSSDAGDLKLLAHRPEQDLVDVYVLRADSEGDGPRERGGGNRDLGVEFVESLGAIRVGYAVRQLRGYHAWRD